ncbi:peptidoglycan DD-metalloendopeptidase family protein [Segatella oulorum]|uniref:murein hydrolase activator EnvC family protein n=1 Tax=Segatella oulorum TaxID=28136 RepID=UPI0028E61F2C|nr:peptidoglycan DD-metalloendopeptidase family protein [Segatella oulorum]
MKKIAFFLLALLLACDAHAQYKQKSAQVKKPQKTIVKKANPTQKQAASSKKAKATKKKAPVYTNASIRGLQGQRSQIQKKIKEQEQALKKNQADVKQRLNTLITLNTQIDERQKNIDGIQKDINNINGNIDILNAQLKTLEQQLADRKTKYIQSMRYLAKHRNVQDKLMFIFSAKSFTQMYRRLRFVREYADFQKAQGEMVMAKQAQVDGKQTQLKQVKGEKNNLLYKGKKEKEALEGQQEEQKKVVASLQNQQKTIQKVIAEQRQKDAALNAQIDKLVAIEVAKARARAAEESRRKAAAKAEAQRKAAEIARKKAEAEAEARENARRIAEAKAHEAKLKAEAVAAAQAAEQARKAQQTADETKKKQAALAAAQAAQMKREAAEQAAREAEAQRVAAEKKAKVEASRQKQEIAEAQKEAESSERLSSMDRMISGGFEANRGRLPMPITGAYKVVSHFGQYNVSGLKGVTLDNKGINIQGNPGCSARAIYDGEVSAVFGYAGSMVVMLRHGTFISVYANLKSVSVSRGQKVKPRQVLGAVGTDNILQFQLRKETSKLNPEVWLGR